MTYLLGLSGALRAASTNTKLLHEAARLYGASLDLADLRLPLYDGDIEENEGIPEAAKRLADQIAAAPAVLISTPEYNKRMSPVLKNAMDWVSRLPGNPWAGKPVAVMSAAAGREGGARAQFDLRLAMVPYRVHLVPGPEILLAASFEQFDDQGHLKSEIYTKALQDLMDQTKAMVG